MTTAATIDLEMKVSLDSVPAIGGETTLAFAYRSTAMLAAGPFYAEVATAQASAVNLLAGTPSTFSLVVVLPTTGASNYRLTESTAEAGLLIPAGAPCVLPVEGTGCLAYTTAGSTFRLAVFYL